MPDDKTRTSAPRAVRRGTSEGGRPWVPSRPIGLARALLKAGYATRKQADLMVTGGRVQIGDEVVTDPRRMVETGETILLDGRPLQHLALRYFALHKPPRVVCDESEAAGRKHVSEFFPRDVPGIAAAGRMDGKTTGLILLANDTAWNTMITTTVGLEEEYRIQVDGVLSDMEIAVMGAGVHLPGLGLFRPHTVRVVERMHGRSVVNIALREGKVRQLRRMLETMRHKLTLVRRVRIGDIRLGDLAVGGVRELSYPEVQSIREIQAAIAHRGAKQGEQEKK